MTSYSHSNFLNIVIKELAERNHTITYWNGLKQSKELAATQNVRILYSEHLEETLVYHNKMYDFDDRYIKF